MSAISAAALASFGLLSAVFQIALAVWPKLAHYDAWILSALAGSCLSAGIIHAWPRFEADHSYHYPQFNIKVKCGDVLSEHGNIVVGFTDTFDTDTSDGMIINPRSVQGQFQARHYDGNLSQLDVEIAEKLANSPIESIETSATKARGKLTRYAIGTTITLNVGDDRFYAAAYGFMRNDLRVSCSVDALWKTLTSTWDAVRTNGSLEPVAIPVIGSELARVGSLDRSSLIKMIALSFVASSREEVVSRQLTIVIHPKDRESVNLLDVDNFLKSL
ncbi:macro domain-containing protein [Streptomyces goshikiensis]|uniref:macro domain-containing protein n=1 Tax=Streptomyces TaxID=1883 RepID=UPI00131B4745|nr:macro domain-containing protein [Streptomyces sp. CB02120-2]